MSAVGVSDGCSRRQVCPGPAKLRGGGPDRGFLRLARPHRAGTSGVRAFRAAPAVSCRLMDALICGQGRRPQHAGSVCEWRIIATYGLSSMTSGQRASGRQTSRSSGFPSGNLYHLRHLEASSNSQGGAPRPRWSNPPSASHCRSVSASHARQSGRGWARAEQGLAAYEQCRGLFGNDPDFVAADRIRDDSGCVLRYQRTFMRPLLPGAPTP